MMKHLILGFSLTIPIQSQLLPIFQTCLATPCVCCKSGVCTTPGEYKYSCNGCIDGFTGPDCTEPCPSNCVSCSQTYFEPDSVKVCYQCRNGYYNGRYQDLPNQPLQSGCSLFCKPGCGVCSTYNNCTQCKAGYFMAFDYTCKACPTDCNECFSSETCVTCKDTYYWNGKSCQSCKENCKTCSSYGSCLECDDNFVLKEDDCMRCPDGCASCSESFSCKSCLEDFYLDKGQCFKCKENCIACSLNEESSYTCTKCQEKYYNLNNTCRECRDGCAICLSYNDCIGCMLGYTEYKGVCNRCPDTCKVCSSDDYCMECHTDYYNAHGTCYICPDTCESCLSVEECLRCMPGFYGKNCSSTCDPNCSNNQCDKTTGQCISCQEGYFLQVDTHQRICKPCPKHCIACTNQSDCLACENGYKGLLCQEECVNCKKGTRCDKTGGYCFEGCTDGLCGVKCDLHCDSKCSSCDRANPDKCEACAPTKFGVECMQSCSNNCNNSVCSDKDGNCTEGCKLGSWGNRCEHKCTEQCQGNRCKRECSLSHSNNENRDPLQCPENCKCDNFGNCRRCIKSFGEMCSKRCYYGCLDEECDRITGKCMKGCRDGYSGSFCDKESLKVNHRMPGLMAVVVSTVVSVTCLTVGIVSITICCKRKRKMCFAEDQDKSSREQDCEILKCQSSSKPLLGTIRNENHETSYIWVDDCTEASRCIDKCHDSCRSVPETKFIRDEDERDAENSDKTKASINEKLDDRFPTTFELVESATESLKRDVATHIQQPNDREIRTVNNGVRGEILEGGKCLYHVDAEGSNSPPSLSKHFGEVYRVRIA